MTLDVPWLRSNTLGTPTGLRSSDDREAPAAAGQVVRTVGE